MPDNNSPSLPLELVIPVYNEGKNIGTTLNELGRQVKTPFRVLICYDFEEDDTLPAIASRTGDAFEIRLVRNRSRGPLEAVLTGLAETTSQAVLVYPADEHHNAGIIDRMFDEFKRGAEIVAASRFIPGGCMVGCHWFKELLTRTAAFLLYYVGRLPVHDPTNGFRLFSRRTLNTIPIESDVGFAYSIELLVKAHRLGWKVTEVPAVWYERKHGSSRFQVARWIPQYLHWFFYAFATTYLRRSPATVKTNCDGVLKNERDCTAKPSDSSDSTADARGASGSGR